MDHFWTEEPKADTGEVKLRSLASVWSVWVID
jgi:hypothetical protein